MSGLVFYHGSRHDFQKPKLNGLGVLWLAPNPRVAQEYSTPHYTKGPGYVWEIHLKAGSKILNLKDLSNPVIRQAFDMMNESARSGMGEWSEKDWVQSADFGLLEYRNWMIGFFKKKRIDGLVVSDKLGGTDIRHESVALLRLSAIESLDRKVVERGEAQTLYDIEKEVKDWDQAKKVAVRYAHEVFV